MKILVSPSSFGTDALNLLKRSGYEVIVNPHGRKLTPDETMALAADCVGIVAGVESLHAPILEKLPKLRCISRSGSGVDNVDLEKARALGIVVKSTPDGPTVAVAELCIGFALALLRYVPKADREIRSGKWKKHIGNLLQGKTVGIVGLGRIGRAVAGRFTGLGCKVVGSDPAADTSWAREHRVDILPLRELIAQADIVCLHVSVESGSKALIGRTELAAMRKPSWLVNLSRGGVVDEEALLGALQTGPLAGAALDVFSQEPYSGPLSKVENVILTPHLGSYAKEARDQMELDAVRNLLETLKSA